jgi:hypothetical protein
MLSEGVQHVLKVSGPSIQESNFSPIFDSALVELECSIPPPDEVRLAVNQLYSANTAYGTRIRLRYCCIPRNDYRIGRCPKCSLPRPRSYECCMSLGNKVSSTILRKNAGTGADGTSEPLFLLCRLAPSNAHMVL